MNPGAPDHVCGRLPCCVANTPVLALKLTNDTINKSRTLLKNKMAPKATTKRSPPPDSDGIFSGMVVLLVTTGVQTRRLQIWKEKLVQMGATVETSYSKSLTHIFAMNLDSLLQQFSRQKLYQFKGTILLYQWLEDSLRLGEKVAQDSYILNLESGRESPNRSSDENSLEPCNRESISGNKPFRSKKIKPSSENSSDVSAHIRKDSQGTAGSSKDFSHSLNSSMTLEVHDSSSDSSLPYNPPDLNRTITEIFGKLINIYRALGDDRRSFSYYKAIPVIEKLPFKIESADQVKHLPAIGKSMQEHIQEIVTTGKLSKLDHFETDEKVRAISLFGEVWGIGPATALKLYEKGHRTLDDLKNEDSLTNSQRIGLEYFDDIRTRIPRDEVHEMELLLQKTGEDLLPGVVVVCGGSFRRGKATCGDMDIVITHPDGKGHVGFLRKYVKVLKDMKFLREDLVFGIHSEQGTDSGVDTYFGLCTYPGRELRHRIDFKVYPKEIYPFGLIAWTGNDVLNRRLRILAESKGFRLDDTGLFPASQGSGGKRVSASTSLKFDTEKEVFEFLGFPWLEPHERNL